MRGWQCPGCGACYAPFVMVCQHCGPKIETTSGVTGFPLPQRPEDSSAPPLPPRGRNGRIGA